MNGRGNGIILAGVAACIGLLLLITPAYSANVIISGDYTDVGTIVVVSPKPGDAATTNGTALLNTLAGITASATEPYLIKLGPGTYDLGSTSLLMKQYVSIEGSGEEATTITAAIGTTFPVAAATVKGANNAGLRFLTVINTGVGGTAAAAILNVSASPSIIHVTANASGGTVYNYGVFNDASSPAMTNVTITASGGGGARGVYNYSGSSPTMTNVTATASGGTSNYGVANNASSPTMTNVTATGDYGLYSFFSGTVKISHSVIKGTTGTIYNAVTTLVADTQLDGGAVTNSGTLTCVGAYNASYVALNTSCQ